MPRHASIEAILKDAVAAALAKATPAFHRHLARLAAEMLEESLSLGGRRSRLRRPRRARGEEITRWVADNRARRVPKFVIAMTGGLDTKKKIVARYGENAAFERGKPLPRPARAA